MKYLFFILILTSFVLADCDNNQIDINFADANELDEIVWIGEATAEKIINERPFDSVEDLDKIYGIGEKKLDDIIEEGLACVDEEIEEKKAEEYVEDKKVDGETRETVDSFFQEEPELVLLNGEEEIGLVYESKNSIVLKYLPHGFCVFLILIIGVLVLQRF